MGGNDMDKFFGVVNKKLGFGCMRLPSKLNIIDKGQVCDMVDAFIAAGFNYFDTAHGYHNGRSETAVRDCLAKRYPRESFILTDKLTDSYFHKEADIRPFFEKQLKACGVDYFDFYLMHAQGAENFEYFKKCRAYETAFDLKAEGKVRHVGLSFHDRADVLDRILTQYPQVEVVQLQFNYADYDDPDVQSRKCYETCVKYGKPVIVMEPVKGGTLARLPDNAKAVLDELHAGSPASFAIRFAAGFDNVMVVLSGMSTIGQMRDNISFMSDLKPLTAEEQEGISKVRHIIGARDLIPCTACHYCTEGCPRSIKIPELFDCLNEVRDGGKPDIERYDSLCAGGAKASDCLKCGKCEHSCPQHLKIRELLTEAAGVFEK